jgi:hypothetical protein
MMLTSIGVLNPVGELNAGRTNDRIRSLLIGSEFVVVSGQVAQQAPRGSQRANFVADGEVYNTALPVYARAAELVRGHVLAQHRLHDPGTGQTEEGVGGLNHEAALSRQVRTAASVVTEHAHDARHHSADLAERGEHLGVAIEAANPCRHERARAIVHPNERHPLPTRQAHEVRELGAVGRVHRASTNREIMTIESDVAALDLDDPRDERSAIQIRTPVLV